MVNDSYTGSEDQRFNSPKTPTAAVHSLTALHPYSWGGEHGCRTSTLLVPTSPPRARSYHLITDSPAMGVGVGHPKRFWGLQRQSTIPCRWLWAVSEHPATPSPGTVSATADLSRCWPELDTLHSGRSPFTSSIPHQMVGWLAAMQHVAIPLSSPWSMESFLLLLLAALSFLTPDHLRKSCMQPLIVQMGA